MNPSKFVDILEPLESLEYYLSLLYRNYANLFVEDKKASELFKSLSRDELNHRDIVRRQRALVIQNYNMFGDVDIDIENLKKLIDTVKKLVDANQVITLEQAVRLAIKIENSAEEQHFRYAIAQSNPNLKELVQILAESDKKHVLELENFAIERQY